MFNKTAATAGNVQQYNWDNFDVGDFHLDHSGNFFEHRRQRDTKENDRNQFNAQIITRGMENISLKPNNSPTISCHRNTLKDQHHKNISTPSRANQLSNNKMPLNMQNPPKGSNNLLSASPINRPVTRAAMKERNVQQINPSTQSANIGQHQQQQLPTSPPPPSRSQTRNAAAVAISSKVLPVAKIFSVVKYEEVYRRKKEQTMKRLAAEDKRKRQFKPNPVPNFAAAHRQMEKKLSTIQKPQFCCPETPQTLKNSLKAREIRDKKIAEQLKSKVEPFVAVEAKVLEQSPYKPHLDHRQIVAKPFPLRMLDRLADRRKYDKQYEEQCEEKRKLELMKKEKEDKQLAKQFRAQTKFTARPNPFH